MMQPRAKSYVKAEVCARQLKISESRFSVVYLLFSNYCGPGGVYFK